ncbi:hypothetical protein M3Y97_01021000 [Aphelenchoides bicaudatus]|nr:hypothetical protein M3Y97_01021000 [Aphelenchoides bicaudatus]
MRNNDDAEEIRFQMPKHAATWYEKLSRKGPSLPENKTLSGYESVSTSPSGRLVFFHFRDQLMVLDTFCGVPTKLRVPAEIYDHDPLISYQFVALDDSEGVMFRRSCVGSHCGNQFGVEVSRFRMGFRLGRLVQATDWVKIVKLYSLYQIVHLPDTQTVLIYGQIVKDRTFGGGGNWVEYVREFDLQKMEFKMEATCFKDSRLHNVGYSAFASKWNNNYYSFFRRRLKAFPLLSTEFGQITQINAETGDFKVLQLENDPSCAYSNSERKHLLYLDGSWHNQHFYLHSCFSNNDERSEYEHLFARLDLETLKWTPMRFGDENSLQTRIPLKMALTNNDELLLIKTGNGRTIQEQPDLRNDPLLNDKFYTSGGHMHCAVYRLALSVLNVNHSRCLPACHPS